MRFDGFAGPREALAFLDRLEPVRIADVLGPWRGEGVPTGHPLDGLLEACGWHGKRFDAAEDCHPLVFRSRGGRLVSVNPAWLAPALPLALQWPPRWRAHAGRVFQAVLPVLATHRPRARLRMTEHRGVTTATLVYDALPILDVLRRVDAGTLLGCMDLRGQPLFFFLLRRPA